MKNNLKHNRRGTALLMTILILTGILVVALGSASIIVTGLKMGRTQMQATKAYFATEAGAERALWTVRTDNGFNYGNCPASGECAVDFDFSPAVCNISDCLTDIDYTLSNDSAYNVSYASVTECIR